MVLCDKKGHSPMKVLSSVSNDKLSHGHASSSESCGASDATSALEINSSKCERDNKSVFQKEPRHLNIVVYSGLSILLGDTHSSLRNMKSEAWNTTDVLPNGNSETSWSGLAGVMVNTTYKYISRNVVAYVCYDLATQNHVEHHLNLPNAGSSMSSCFTSKELMRYIVFAFAYSLSADQRKDVISLLSNKLDLVREHLGKQDEYLGLLRIIDDLVSCAGKDVFEDPLPLRVVNDVADLLIRTASNAKEETQDRKRNILIMLLEAKYLLRTASSTYKALLERTRISDDFRKYCVPHFERVLRADEKLRDAANYVSLHDTWDGLEESQELRTVCDELHSIHRYYRYTFYSSSIEAIEGMDSLFGQIKNIAITCEVLLYGEISSDKHDLGSEKEPGIQELNIESSCLSSNGVLSGEISLRNHQQIVSHLHKIIVHGLRDMSSSRLATENRDGGVSPTTSHDSSVEVLCSRFVACHAKEFVSDLLGRKCGRTLSPSEVTSLNSIVKTLGELLRSEDSDSSRRALMHREAFQSLVLNICVNLASGNTCRVFGENKSIERINHRALATYVNLFCDLPPKVMRNSRAELKKTFAEYGEKLPNKVDEILRMLTDLKHFCYASSYGGVGSNGDVYSGHYDANKNTVVATLKTLAKLCAFHASNDTLPGSNLELLTWISDCYYYENYLSVSRVLLHECKLMAEIASTLAQGIEDVSQGKKLSFFDSSQKVYHKVSRVLTGKDLKTTNDLKTHRRAISNRIKKVYKDIRGLLEKCSDATEVCSDGNTYGPHLNNAIRHHHSLVWDKISDGRVTDELITERLISYMLCMAYASARHTSEIINKVRWKDHKACMPSLATISREYLPCGSAVSDNYSTAVPLSTDCDQNWSCALEGEEVSNDLEEIALSAVGLDITCGERA